MDLNILNNTQEDAMETISGGGDDFKEAQKCMSTGISDLRNVAASVRQANQKLFERKKSCSREPVKLRKSRNNNG